MTDDAQRAAFNPEAERMATIALVDELIDRMRTRVPASLPLDNGERTDVFNVGFDLRERDLVISALWTLRGEL